MPQSTDALDAAYRGPPRKPEEVIARALSSPELMRQLAGSLDAQRRGLPPVPSRELRAEAKRRDAARDAAHRTAWMLEARFEGPQARRFYDGVMSPTGRASADPVIARLERDPFPGRRHDLCYTGHATPAL